MKGYPPVIDESDVQYHDCCAQERFARIAVVAESTRRVAKKGRVLTLLNVSRLYWLRAKGVCRVRLYAAAARHVPRTALMLGWVPAA